MNISVYEGGGRLDGGYSVPGMTLTGPLLLSGTVTLPAEAVHKQYVDTSAMSLNANNITTGTLAASRLPALSGDIAVAEGTNLVNLSATGVIAGDYAKVTADASGRVILGSSLTEADLPAMDWSKISLDRPTTLAGYGITDGVKNTGDTMLGSLKLFGAPTLPNQLATKLYADNAMILGGTVSTGDVITRNIDVTPAGYLRCNGADINKTTFNGLYTVVGDTFSYMTQPGAGQPWQQQYQINDQQATDIKGWVTPGYLPAPLTQNSAIVTKSRVYLLGGYNGTSYVTTVYTAPINSDGTLGAWTTGTALPAVQSQAQCFIHKGYVYMCGGWNGSAYVATGIRAAINADGTLGGWSPTNVPSLPSNVAWGMTFLTKSRVYVVGGYDGAWKNTVYYAPLLADGSIGAWVTDTVFPQIIQSAAVAVTKNRVYIIGGATASGTATSNVYYATINSDGSIGAWTLTTALPVGYFVAQSYVTKNRVYLIGGRTGANDTANTYSAPINADGSLGTWVAGTALPMALSQAQVVVTKNHIYLLSGYLNNANFNSNVYMAIISGGVNDYSSYYLGTAVATDPANFRLPDYSTYENAQTYYFIKT